VPCAIGGVSLREGFAFCDIAHSQPAISCTPVAKVNDAGAKRPCLDQL
jgi:hypothetical protein